MKLSELTSRHRLGFGSFVDKTVAPYLRHERWASLVNRANSFAYARERFLRKLSYSRQHHPPLHFNVKHVNFNFLRVGKPFVSGGVSKDIPYDYKHVQTFTDDVDEFSVSLNGLSKIACTTWCINCNVNVYRLMLTLGFSVVHSCAHNFYLKDWTWDYMSTAFS